MRNRMFSVSAFAALFFMFWPFCLRGQINSQYPMELKWLGVEKEVFSGDTLSYINLESGAYEGVMPVYCKVFPIFDDAVKVKVE